MLSKLKARYVLSRMSDGMNFRLLKLDVLFWSVSLWADVFMIAPDDLVVSKFNECLN